MKRWLLFATMTLAVFRVGAYAQDAAPLKLVQTIKLSPEIKGNFDHFAVDMKGSRLFATPEGYKSVLVLDMQSGKLIHTIQACLLDREYRHVRPLVLERPQPFR